MFGTRRPKISRSEALASKPVQLVSANTLETADGGLKLTVRLRQARWASWLFRLPEGATKTFELDPIGRLVWTSCDGKTSVQQIIRKLARTYNLNLREAEVPTIRFLQMLVKKGLVGMPVKAKDRRGSPGERGT